MSIQPGTGYTFSTSNGISTINVEQPWVNYYTLPKPAPFTVSFRYIDESMWASVIPGTINNIVPQVEGTENKLTDIPAPEMLFDFNSGDEVFVYLRAGINDELNKYPSTIQSEYGYPCIELSASDYEDGDNEGYIKLALIKHDPDTDTIAITQFVNSSLWSERHKYTEPDTSMYYHYRI